MDEDDGRVINLRDISVSPFLFKFYINIHCTYFQSVVSEFTPEYRREYDSFFLTKDEWRGIFYNGMDPLANFENHHPFFDLFNDSEDEKPDLPKPQKSFKTDTCVISLIKEPNILFTDCLHICICLDCEEIKPFSRCPFCRTRSETKVMI